MTPIRPIWANAQRPHRPTGSSATARRTGPTRSRMRRPRASWTEALAIEQARSYATGRHAEAVCGAPRDEGCALSANREQDPADHQYELASEIPLVPLGWRSVRRPGHRPPNRRGRGKERQHAQANSRCDPGGPAHRRAGCPPGLRPGPGGRRQPAARRALGRATEELSVGSPCTRTISWRSFLPAATFPLDVVQADRFLQKAKTG